jgi:hypothetical protein
MYRTPAARAPGPRRIFPSNSRDSLLMIYLHDSNLPPHLHYMLRSIVGRICYVSRFYSTQHVSLLSAFIPLVQRRLSYSRHHPPYFLVLHHAFIAHEFLCRSCRNRRHADKDFGCDQVLKCLGTPQLKVTRRNESKVEQRTVIMTSLPHLTMPILPPST